VTSSARARAVGPWHVRCQLIKSHSVQIAASSLPDKNSAAIEAPFGRLLQDALALPMFGGGNMGIRRRQLHAPFMHPDDDRLAAAFRS